MSAETPQPQPRVHIPREVVHEAVDESGSGVVHTGPRERCDSPSCVADVAARPSTVTRTGRLSALDRFRAKVRIGANGCLLWTAATDRYGYGGFRDGHRWRLAHRWHYEHVFGAIPDGLVLDHLCRTRSCVNPDHLRAVTHRDNQLAPGSQSDSAANAVKTHCSRGHEFVAGNTYERWRMRHGWRKCRACSNANSKASHLRRRLGIHWTEEQLQAYADRKYLEYVAAPVEVV